MNLIKNMTQLDNAYTCVWRCEQR